MIPLQILIYAIAAYVVFTAIQQCERQIATLRMRLYTVMNEFQSSVLILSEAPRDLVIGIKTEVTKALVKLDYATLLLSMVQNAVAVLFTLQAVRMSGYMPASGPIVIAAVIHCVCWVIFFMHFRGTATFANLAISSCREFNDASEKHFYNTLALEEETNAEYVPNQRAEISNSAST